MIYTDNGGFASGFMPEKTPWQAIDHLRPPPSIVPFLEALVPGGQLVAAVNPQSQFWDHLILVDTARESQFDALYRSVRGTPDFRENLLCVAGTGENFHGFKNRPWRAARGNLHLSALLSPHTAVPHPGVAFTILAVVSVLQTVDELCRCSERVGVKWVNDILIGGAKIGGVLANAMIQGEAVTHATLGIGLNIENTPVVPPSPFVPAVGSLQQCAEDPPNCSLRLVFHRLITYLGANYRSLLAGGYPRLLELYRSRSVVLGRRVRLHGDTNDETPGALVQGVVSFIGDDLELFIDHAPSPVFSGRLELLTD